MRELRKYNVYIACHLEVIILDNGHLGIRVPGEEACYHLCHNDVVDDSGRHEVAIAPNEAAQTALLWTKDSFSNIHGATS